MGLAILLAKEALLRVQRQGSVHLQSLAHYWGREARLQVRQAALDSIHKQVRS